MAAVPYQNLGWTNQQAFTNALLGGSAPGYTNVKSVGTPQPYMGSQVDSILQQLGITPQRGDWTGTVGGIQGDYTTVAGAGGLSPQTLAQLQSKLGPGYSFGATTTADPGTDLINLMNSQGQTVGSAGFDPRPPGRDWGFDATLLGIGLMGGAAFMGAGAAGEAGVGATEAGGAVTSPVLSGSVAATDLGTLAPEAAAGAGGAASAVGAGTGGAADVGAGTLSTNLSMPGFSGAIGPQGAGTLAGDAGGAAGASGGPSLGNIFQGANLASKAVGGTGKGGSMDWTSLLGQGLTSWMGYQQGNQMARAGQAADPFAPYRPGFAQQLQQLMANPSSVTSLPGYQANLQAGEQALTRNLASQGLTGSGTAAEAITKFGAEYEQQAFQQQLQNLMGLSGANINNADLTLQALSRGMGAKSNAVNALGGAFGGMGGGDWLSGIFGDMGSWLGDNSFLGDLGSGSSWFGDLLGI